MIKMPIDINFDFSKVKVTQINDKYIIYQLDNMILKLYNNDAQGNNQEVLEQNSDMNSMKQ